MKQHSKMRDNVLWGYGSPKYHYYIDVFDRWVRMFGPDVCIPDLYSIGNGVGSNSKGFRLLRAASKDADHAARRISMVIKSENTRKSFGKYVTTQCGPATKVYVRGRRLIITDRQKINRFYDLYFMKSLLDQGEAIRDALDKMDEIAEKFLPIK